MCSRTRGAEKWREARKRENIQVREGRIDAGSERNRGGGERGEQQNDLGAANNKPYALTPGRFTPRTYVCTRTRSQCLVSYPRCRYNATLLRCYREQHVSRRGLQARHAPCLAEQRQVSIKRSFLSPRSIESSRFDIRI